MEISQLATSSVEKLYGSAIRGYGHRLGRSLQKKSGEALFIIILVACALGGIILPFKFGSHFSQWYPYTFGEFIIKVWLKKLFLFAISGFLMLFFAAYIYAVMVTGANSGESGEEVLIGINKALSVFSIISSLGFFVGLTRRKKRKNAYILANQNQEFLDKHGIKEFEAKNYNYIDNFDNKLQKDFESDSRVEFNLINKKGYRSCIDINENGRFIAYEVFEETI